MSLWFAPPERLKGPAGATLNGVAVTSVTLETALPLLTTAKPWLALVPAGTLPKLPKPGVADVS